MENPEDHPREIARRRLFNSRQQYFRFRKRETLAGMAAVLVGISAFLLAFLDSERFQLWLGCGCVLIPVGIGVSAHSTRQFLRLNARRKNIANAGETSSSWMHEEKTILEKETHALHTTRTWYLGVFLTGFALLLSGLISQKPTLLVGVGLGLILAGALLLSDLLMREFYTREYQHWLGKL